MVNASSLPPLQWWQKWNDCGGGGVVGWWGGGWWGGGGGSGGAPWHQLAAAAGLLFLLVHVVGHVKPRLIGLPRLFTFQIPGKNTHLIKGCFT